MFKLNVTNNIVRCFYSPLIFLLPKVYHDINIFNKQKPWFNYECRMARTNYRRSKRNQKFRRSRNLEENTKRLEKHYKKVLDTSIRTHRQKIRNKINNLKSTNPREYWKIINSGNKKIVLKFLLIFCLIILKN